MVREGKMRKQQAVETVANTGRRGGEKRRQAVTIAASTRRGEAAGYGGGCRRGKEREGDGEKW